MSTAKPTDKTAKSHGKDIKKQETMDELPEEQVPPPPRTAVMLLESYPDKMISIHQTLEEEEQAARDAELARSQPEADPKKTGKMAESSVINNKSSMANKSTVSGQNASQPGEEEKTRRKDSLDVKHLENEPLHFCYTQNKNVLHIDTSKSVNEIENMLDEHPDGYHISFWVFFETIKYDHPKNNITFLTFGSNQATKYLTFCLEKMEKKEKDSKGKEILAQKNNLVVKYLAEDTGKVGRIVSEAFIQPNKLYFVTLSVIRNSDGYTEVRLTVNAKIEGSQSSNIGIKLNCKHIVVGSEVTSSPFKGLLSDLLIVTIPFDVKEQKEFYDNYWDYPNGARGKELLDDQLIHAKINEKYQINGCPRKLLKNYKYDDEFKRSIQEKRNQKEVIETEEEIKAKTDKSKAAKLEYERQQKRIKADVNSFVDDLQSQYPLYYEYLKNYVESRKWIFKSWNLYSPTIKKLGEPKLSFQCIHNTLSKLQNLPVPFYAIEEEYFFKVLNMVRELNNELKRILIKFAEITETIFKDKDIGIYISYDRWLHYLCWAEKLKPEGWVEKVQEENEEEEEEDMSSSEEDLNAHEEKKIDPNEEQHVYVENMFFGDKKGLKDKLKQYMHELNETAEEETGDIPKMYYENRKLHSFEIVHDTDRIQSVTYNYIVRSDENTPWSEVMAEYEASGVDPTATDPNDAKKDEKKDKGGAEQKKVVNSGSNMYRFEQVKGFQEKLPEDEPKGTAVQAAPTGPDGRPIEEAAKPKKYKFPDAKNMTRDVFKVLNCEKITFKSVDHKIYQIRAFYKDGKTHRLEINKHMSPEFEAKREKKLKEIKHAEDQLAKQVEDEKHKEKEKREREQRERRERRENKKNKEEFVKGPEEFEAPKEEIKWIEIPKLGDYDSQRADWIPGKECNFSMSLINEDNHLICFGLYKDHHAAVKIHNPESLEEVPINNFKDVLKHICKRHINENDSFRVRHLKFKYTVEKFLEVGAMVERKGHNESKWYTDIQEEKARIRRNADEEQERARREEEEKRAKAPPGMAPPAEEKRPEKKKEEERTPEELEEEKEHLFYVDFVHEDIARQRRIEEIAARKATKERLKGDDKKKPVTKDAKTDGKKDGKDNKKDGKDGKKKDDKSEIRKEDVIHTVDIDLIRIQKIRVDHKSGQVTKILFHYNDESVTTIDIPAMSPEKSKEFMNLVQNENKQKELEYQKRVEEYNRDKRKHERAQKRKRIQARKNGEVYVPTRFDKKKPEPKIESDEEKKVSDQSIFYINNSKPIDGLWAIFKPELKYFKFWGVQFQQKKTEDERKREKEEEETRKAAALEEEKRLAMEGEDEDNKVDEQTTKRWEEKQKEAHKLKDDFIRNYSLSRLGLKLVFFIDYHVTREKDETKETITVNSQKFKDGLFKNNYDALTRFLTDILPESVIVANFKKLGAIGLFRVYTYGFGENPEQEKEFFSNRHVKIAFPDIKKLYYDLIDEFVRYDDLKRLERRQRDELHRQGINVPGNDSKKTQTSIAN